MLIKDFAERLNDELKTLPGHAVQEKMAAEHRLPHEHWKRYYATARLSGVLILFYPIDTGIHTVLIQRPTYDGVHSGQVAFPGGRKEEQDKDIIATALREAHEEIGIDMRLTQVLGRLTDLYVPPSNFLISPVVGYSFQRPRFVLDKNEVEAIIEPQITELTDEKATGVKSISIRQGVSIKAPYYNIQGRTVWGATAMIISELNEVIRRI